MAVLKYQIVDIDELKYIGYKVQVPLKDIDSIDFRSFWNKVMSEYIIQEGEYYIGYQDYNSFDGKCFDYYALAPMRDYCSIEGREVRTIPSGKYYMYQSCLESHDPAFFQAVYGNLKRKGVRHDSTFDLEMIPYGFTYENPKAVLYVAVREKE